MLNTDSVLQQSDVSVQLEALDILGDLLSRFGGEHQLEVQCERVNGIQLLVFI